MIKPNLFRQIIYFFVSEKSFYFGFTKDFMEKTLLPVKDQVKKGLDGRSQRWLCLQVGILESELSKKMKGMIDFSEDEIKRINELPAFQGKNKIIFYKG